MPRRCSEARQPDVCAVGASNRSCRRTPAQPSVATGQQCSHGGIPREMQRPPKEPCRRWASRFPAHYMRMFIDKSPGKRRRWPVQPPARSRASRRGARDIGNDGDTEMSVRAEGRSRDVGEAQLQPDAVGTDGTSHAVLGRPGDAWGRAAVERRSVSELLDLDSDVPSDPLDADPNYGPSVGSGLVRTSRSSSGPRRTTATTV